MTVLRQVPAATWGERSKPAYGVELQEVYYAGEPYLFKIEFAARGDSIQQLNEDESIMDFVGEYCTLFRQQLRAATNQAGQSKE